MLSVRTVVKSKEVNTYITSINVLYTSVCVPSASAIIHTQPGEADPASPQTIKRTLCSIPVSAVNPANKHPATKGTLCLSVVHGYQNYAPR